MSKRKRKPPPPAPTSSSKTATPQLTALAKIEASYRGPMPLPSHLEQYERILPGAAERILSLAEKQATHRRELEQRVVGAEIQDLTDQRHEIRRGQFCGLGAVALALVTSLILGLNGHALAGGLIGGGGLVGLAAVFVVGNLYRKAASPRESHR